MLLPDHKVYSFAQFELDGLLFELRREGKPLAIQPKPLRLLFYLVRYRHRAISTSELLTQLWPHEVVTANSVARAVLATRHCLASSNASHEFIVTVRSFGYRFNAPVTEDDRAPLQLPSAQPSGHQTVIPRRRKGTVKRPGSIPLDAASA